MSQRDTERQATPSPPRRLVLGRVLLARNLKKWRAARKLSQEQVAELSGLNRPFISQLEHAHYNISLDNICQIAAALGIHPQRLLDDDDGGDDETNASSAAARPDGSA